MIHAILAATLSCVAPPEADRFIHEPRQVRLAVPLPARDPGAVTINTIDGPMVLHLQLASVRAPDAICLADRGGGQMEPVPLPPVATFRGVVEGMPRSAVAAAVVAEGFRAVIDLDTAKSTDALVYIQPGTEIGRGPGHVMYTSGDVASGEWACGAGGRIAPGGPQGYGPRASCASIAEIAIDADYEFFQANGSSVANSVADIESVMVANDVIYLRDVHISHQSTAYVIRTSMNDPYTMTEPGAFLDQFRSTWIANHAAIGRDVAHLMTGREMDGNVIGVAWLNAVCGSYAYGLSQTLFTPDLVYRVELTAHELGHNWGAGHCDGDSDCSIMCSGIGGCANNPTMFSSRSINEIGGFRGGLTCLSIGFPVAHDDSARTIVGVPVRIDVLANDSPADCGSITISAFPAVTGAANSVSRSVGTGPGGRDELLFTPRAGYQGTDAFQVTIRNGAGAPAMSTARIEVLSPRPPDAPATTAPGLAAAYYHTLPLSVAEIPRGRFVSTGTAATIDFPSSTGNIAGGTRHDGVGMVLTGVVQIPAAGAYTFYTESDDGSTLYINDRLVLINDGPQGGGEVGGAITLPAGPATVRVEYIQVDGTAGLVARVEGPGVTKQVIPPAWWSAPGVSITFLELGTSLLDLPPDFASLTPVRTGVVASLNQSDFSAYFAGSARRLYIAGVFRGYVSVPARGLYTFYTTSDDASTLAIGGQLVVSNRGVHGPGERSGVVALEPGLHSVRIEFWQGGGGGALIVSYEGPGVPKQPIPEFVRDLADCNGDGIDDATQVVAILDLGDIAVGGNGRGTGAIGAGINPLTGLPVSASAFGGNRGAGTSAFQALDGQGGRPNFPQVEGVFIPTGATTYAAGRPPFVFSSASGVYWDCIRNGRSLFESGVQPIIIADRPSTPRQGLGMHANSGITFDLDQIRIANPGRHIVRARGVAGLSQDGCAGTDVVGEMYVLIDGVAAYRSILSDDALAQQFDVAIPGGAQFLSLALLDAGNPTCDHFAIADAQLLLDSGADADEDGVLDACQCPADFNHDGGVDGRDVEAFFLAWQASDPAGDVNRDGGVDGRDVEAFFVPWEAGGC